MLQNLDKIEENIRKCKIIQYSQNGRINMMKMTTIPKAIYRFNKIPVKFQGCFPQIEKKYFRIQRELQKNNKNNSKHTQNNVQGVTTTDLKIYQCQNSQSIIALAQN